MVCDGKRSPSPSIVCAFSAQRRIMCTLMCVYVCVCVCVCVLLEDMKEFLLCFFFFSFSFSSLLSGRRLLAPGALQSLPIAPCAAAEGPSADPQTLQREGRGRGRAEDDRERLKGKLIGGSRKKNGRERRGGTEAVYVCVCMYMCACVCVVCV